MKWDKRHSNSWYYGAVLTDVYGDTLYINGDGSLYLWIMSDVAKRIYADEYWTEVDKYCWTEWRGWKWKKIILRKSIVAKQYL